MEDNFFNIIFLEIKNLTINYAVIIFLTQGISKYLGNVLGILETFKKFHIRIQKVKIS